MLAACGVALALSACDLNSPSKNAVESISGTLQPFQPGSGNSHTFKASKNGELSVTITAVTPSPSTGGSIAVYLGQVVNNSCALIPGYSSSVIVNRAIQFFQINKGDYCLYVYDPGVITVATTYTGTISHP